MHNDYYGYSLTQENHTLIEQFILNLFIEQCKFKGLNDFCN